MNQNPRRGLKMQTNDQGTQALDQRHRIKNPDPGPKISYQCIGSILHANSFIMMIMNSFCGLVDQKKVFLFLF